MWAKRNGRTICTMKIIRRAFRMTRSWASLKILTGKSGWLPKEGDSVVFSRIRRLLPIIICRPDCRTMLYIRLWRTKKDFCGWQPTTVWFASNLPPEWWKYIPPLMACWATSLIIVQALKPKMVRSIWVASMVLSLLIPRISRRISSFRLLPLLISFCLVRRYMPANRDLR